MKKCCICGKEYEGWGNNPYPVRTSDGECCDDCNAEFVIPYRIVLSKASHEVVPVFAEKLNGKSAEELKKILTEI